MQGTPALSPDGRYAVFFQDGHWHAYDHRRGEIRNLTGIAGRNFFSEDHDSPSRPSAYGSAAFTRDSRSILVPDRFDVWQIALDGSLIRNLTDGAGRREKLELRVLALNNDPKAPGIDPSAPVLLQARHVDTQESGFYRDSFDPAQQPERLVMAPLCYSPPLKAKNADVLVTSAQSFGVFPDL
jgi:hypothetical protein